MYIDEKRMWLRVGISLLLRRVRSIGHAKAKVISPGPGLEIIITNVWPGERRRATVSDGEIRRAKVSEGERR